MNKNASHHFAERTFVIPDVVVSHLNVPLKGGLVANGPAADIAG